MNIVNGTCQRCGCSDHELGGECECGCKVCGSTDVPCDCERISRKINKYLQAAVPTNPELMRDYWRCFDCLQPDPPSQIREHVWFEAWPTYREDKQEIRKRDRMLNPSAYDSDGRRILGKNIAHALMCPSCIEVRLRRPLTLDDFTPAKINNAYRFGYVMGARDNQALNDEKNRRRNELSEG